MGIPCKRNDRGLLSLPLGRVRSAPKLYRGTGSARALHGIHTLRTGPHPRRPRAADRDGRPADPPGAVDGPPRPRDRRAGGGRAPDAGPEAASWPPLTSSGAASGSTAAARSGASTGTYEVKAWAPGGAPAALKQLPRVASALHGASAEDQAGVDERLHAVDGTKDFSGIG